MAKYSNSKISRELNGTVGIGNNSDFKVLIFLLYQGPIAPAARKCLMTGPAAIRLFWGCHYWYLTNQQIDLWLYFSCWKPYKLMLLSWRSIESKIAGLILRDAEISNVFQQRKKYYNIQYCQVRLYQEHQDCNKTKIKNNRKLSDATYMVHHKQGHMINKCWEHIFVLMTKFNIFYLRYPFLSPCQRWISA